MEPVTAALLAKPAGKLATRLLSPIIKNIEAKVSARVQKAFHSLFNAYTNYLDQTYDRHSFFSSVVFKNDQKLLKEYYIPLTLVKQRDQEYTIDSYPSEEFDAIRKILIVDTAGMGKTTISKFLFINCVESQLGIPIFIELRKLSKKVDALDFIIDQLSELSGDFRRSLFFELLKSGEFIFFFDGYDEIMESDRAQVSSDLQNFMTKAAGNRFIITSRDETGLQAFPQFQRYHIRPLKKDEAFSLLRKYANNKLADDLIDRLKLPQNSSIHEFLTNPLLTSLLYKSYEYKQTVPLKRHIFYRQVYEALYETHDLAKEGGEFNRSKRSGLDIDRMEKMLRAIGAISYKAGKVELDNAGLLDIITKASILCAEKKVRPSEVLHDLLHAIPLLVRDGNYVRWSHRSIQEYFAAQFICALGPEAQNKIMRDYYQNEKISQHANLISLYSDMNPQGFNSSIGVWLAKDLIQQYDALFPHAPPEINDADITERKSLAVGRRYFFQQFNMGSDVDKFIDSPEFKEYQERIRRLLGVKDSSGISWQLSSPGIGKLSSPMDAAATACVSRTTLPFLKRPNGRIRSNVSLADLCPTELSVIDDDPGNPVNSSRCFKIISSMMMSMAGWQFELSAAAEFIANVDRLEREQNQIDVWQ